MKRFLFFTVVAVLFAACSKDALNEQQGIQNIVDEAPATLTVGFEDDETRIQLNEDVKTVWTNGDLVSVFYHSNANQKWQYAGETGARTADLERVDAGEATAQINRVVVLYPYNESYFFNTETFNVQTTLPAEQTYLADSYGLDGNIMVSSSEFNQFKLKTVYGWLKLQLTGNGEQIKSITVRGNNGEQVAGEAYINTSDATMTLAADKLTTDDDGEVSGSLIFDNTILKEVTLNCVDGVTLGAEATSFYIALPPQTFTKGLTVEITATNGLVMTKSTDNEVVIERNHIKQMTAFAADLPVPETWKIYYTATAKVEPYDKTVFGATYVSNEWDSETGEGVITFEGDVTKIGEYAFYKCSSLTSVTIGDSVKTIGYSAFSSCSSLTSVIIPNSVTTIGMYAFRYCDSLTSVTIPNSVTTIGGGAFCDCTSLTSVTIPENVTEIGEWAFKNCYSLKEFKGKFAADGGRCLIIDGVLNAFALGCGVTQYTIPDSVTTIGYWAFYNCGSLTSVTIPESVTKIGWEAFAACTNLKTVYCKRTTPPTGGGSMFDDNASGRKIYVPASDDDSIIKAYKEPSGWSEYKDYIFEDEPKPANNEIWYTATAKVEPYKKTVFGATYVSNKWDSETGNGVITFEGDVTKIGVWAFWSCDSLTSVTIPDSVTTIGEKAFYHCESLTSVTIPDSITTIGEGTFEGCESLTSVTIGDSVTTIGERAFNYCLSLTSVTIGNSVTTIGSSAFRYCESLKEFKGKFAADGGRCLIIDGVLNAFALGCGVTQYTIPDSVTTIGSYAFSYCDSLTSVTIPDSVTTIGEWAFYFCNSLTSVTIPDSVTTIGERAFFSCDSLKYVYCKPTTPPTGGESMFWSNASGRKIYVPASDDDSIINAYKAKEYWSSYKDSIFEEEE